MSDDDWEKPDFEPVKKPANKSAAVKDSWDGEDEEGEDTPLPPTTTAAAKSPPAVDGAANPKIAAVEHSIDRLNPVTLPEFEMLRNNVEIKLAPLASSPYYNVFMEELIRDLCAALPPDSLKKVNSGLTMIINDKTAAQKPKKGGKKKGVSVKMDRGHGQMDIHDDAVYDDFDDM